VCVRVVIAGCSARHDHARLDRHSGDEDVVSSLRAV
jgi:hypothetical protein